jgi:hypothetical protein
MSLCFLYILNFQEDKFFSSYGDLHTCCDLGVNLPRTGTDHKCELNVVRFNTKETMDTEIPFEPSWMKSSPHLRFQLTDMLCLRSEAAFVITCVANLMVVNVMYVQQDLRYEMSSYLSCNV